MKKLFLIIALMFTAGTMGAVTLYDILYVFDAGTSEGAQVKDVINMRVVGLQPWSDTEKGEDSNGDPVFAAHGVRYKVVSISVTAQEETDHVVLYGRSVKGVTETANGTEMIYLAVDDKDSPQSLTRKVRSF